MHTHTSASGPDGWPPGADAPVDREDVDIDGGWPEDIDGAGAVTAGQTRWTASPWESGDDALVLAALLTRVMLQDAEALSTLYQLLSGAVYAQLLRLTRQAALAEELLEDVFWQVWRQAPRYDAQRGPVRAWVMVMARSRALDALRRQRRNPVVAMEALPPAAELDATATVDDPHAQLVAAQAGAALHAALDRLDPLRRQLVALTYFRGLSQQEVADHTGLPLGTVKSHLRRALATLRDTLAPAGPPAGSNGVPAP